MAHPRLLVPEWWRDPSGLILPATTTRRRVLPPGSVPPSIRPARQPVALVRHQPDYTDQITVYADETAAGLPVSSLEDVEEMLGVLPFESSMCALARLAGAVYAWRDDPSAQLRLAHEIFGDGSVLRNLEGFMDEQDGRRILFHEQHIFVLQRLLIENAGDEPRRLFTTWEGRVLSRSLLGATALGAAMTEQEIDATPEMLGWLPFFIQNGAYNRQPLALGELARAQELFQRIPQTPKIAGSIHVCPLDEWMREDYGIGIEDQFTLGFALLAMTRAFQTDETAGSGYLVGPGGLDDLMLKLGWAGDQRRAALAVIAGDRETFRMEFAAKGTSSRHIAWDVLPFMRHPFLKCADGSLALLSPRALLSWLSDGFHYRLLDCAQRRAALAGNSKISRRYTALAGQLVEDYALGLAGSVHAGDRPPGGGRVYGEQPYGKKGSQRTCDIAVDLGLDLVLVEVGSSRFRAETLLLAGLKQAEQDLERVLITKINQLSNCIDALASGIAQIPNDSVEYVVDYKHVKRVWPVLVTASGVTQTPPLWHFIRSKAPNALRQAKVQPLTILDLEDFEVLCALVEEGHALHTLLAGKTKPAYKELELASWLLGDPTAPRQDFSRPKMVRAAFDLATKRSVAMMDLAKGFQPEAELKAA